MFENLIGIFKKETTSNDALTEREQRRLKEKEFLEKQKSLSITFETEEFMVEDTVTEGSINLDKLLLKEEEPNDKYENDIVTLLREFKAEEYKVLWNVQLPSNTQSDKTKIDVILICPFKIFVFEINGYTRCTDIREKSSTEWEAYYGAKTKYTIPNPLEKNEQNILLLSEYLEISRDDFKSIVIFIAGDECDKKYFSDDLIFVRESEEEIIKTKVFKLIEEEYFLAFSLDEIHSYSQELYKLMNLDRGFLK